MKASLNPSGRIYSIVLFSVMTVFGCLPAQDPLSQLDSPILFRGDDSLAYRDPAVLYHEKTFYLFFTLTETEPDDSLFWYTALSKSQDLMHWSQPRRITPRDQNLNFSSPGNMIRLGEEWILCLQTYPIPGYTRSSGELQYGTGDSRIWIMRSSDLEQWSEAELLKVKGNDVATQDMGRMIDPYLIEDKDEPGKWWCFYKQNGVSYSWSYDLENWTFSGRTQSGENVCVLIDGGEYLLFHSPENGMGVKRSTDLVSWRDVGELIILGQVDWPWAERRLTAGVVLDLRQDVDFGKYIMFYHGEGPGKENSIETFVANCSIGIAWSDDLVSWDWPKP
jgi:hypothetical protein